MLLLRLIGLLILVQSVQAVPQLLDIRHAPHETYYRIVFDLTERTPVEIERHLDQGYIDVILHGNIQLLAKHLQQPVSPHLLQINLHDVAPDRLVYRLDLSDVLEVHAFRQGGGSGFRFVVDCLHRSSGAPATREAEATPPEPARTEVRKDSSSPSPEQTDRAEEAPDLSHEELLQLLEIVATLEQAGDPETACRILEKELVTRPDADTLHFRLGSIYLTGKNTEEAYAHLDPLLLKPTYGVVVARMLAGYDNSISSQESASESNTDNPEGAGGIPELSLKLLLAGLVGLILVGAGLLVRHKMVERKHLASFDSDSDTEDEATPDKEAKGRKARKKKDEKKKSAGDETSSPAADEDRPADGKGEDKPGYERDKEVYRLADKKKGTAEIAGTLGLSQDEVRLILQMRHQESNSPSEKEDEESQENES